jgi:ribonuclease P protein component
MKHTYPKHEKLKSRTLINQLFTEGKSVSKYPLRLAYVQVSELEDSNIKLGVSVSKKHFKKAVDRNYYKRVLRETYRLNKSILIKVVGDKKYAFMLLYQTKDRLTYQEVHEKTIQLFEKFASTIEKDTAKV